MPRPPRKPRPPRGRFSEPLKLDLKTGEIGRDYGKRPRHHRGATVNQPLNLPTSPDRRLVNEDECSVCGEIYKAWRGSGCTIDLIEPTGPYKSRGTMLWALRVCKMGEWYQRHYVCVQWWRTEPDLRAAKLPQSVIWDLIHGPGCVSADTKLTRPQRAYIEKTDEWCSDIDPDLERMIPTDTPEWVF